LIEIGPRYVDSDFDIKTRVTTLEEIKTAKKGGEDCLVVIYPPTPGTLGKRFLLQKDAITVGRDRENDIVLVSDSVSRRHCKIEHRAGRLFAVDLDSTNGTFINDETEPITDIQLRRGDQIKIGDTIFKYLGGSDVEAQYHETIYKMTIMDGLTDVHNKRYLIDLLEREIPRALRHKRPLSVLMIDIDHFKSVNDTYGHLAGDAVLKDVASILRSRLRPDDTLSRYGGEEFAAALPETPVDGAADIAEQLRHLVETHPFAFEGEKIRVTISIGVAELKPGLNTEGLFKAADEMMYQAKREGRNCVRPDKSTG
jgi:diguanylate cyclase (GGDEF)-like protein